LADFVFPPQLLLCGELKVHSAILIVTDTKDAEALQEKNDLKIKTFEEYPQPR